MKLEGSETYYSRICLEALTKIMKSPITISGLGAEDYTREFPNTKWEGNLTMKLRLLVT
jgi:hypothetical protein